MRHDPDYMHTFADRHPQFVLEDVRVPASAILGGVGRADELTNEWFVEERIHIGARCTGAMERLLTLAVDWATERIQFGERIYDFQGVSFPLADSAADASAARLLTREAALLVDAGADPKVVHAKASLAKLFASEAAFRCADRVVQVFGGRGYMREHAGRALLPRAARRPDLGGHVGDPAADHRPGPREARRRPWSAEAAPMTGLAADRPPAPDATGAIDLRPLFAPRSVAIVGASARGWIAGTVRDNLRSMGSATRCHFVNPNYDELLGQPCYPSLADLPETARHRARGAQSAPGGERHRGRRRRRHPGRDHPGRRCGRGRGGGGGDAGRGGRHRAGTTAWRSSGRTAWASST